MRDAGRHGVTLLLALALSLVGVQRARAGCDSTEDLAKLADARALAAMRCDCATAESHGSYINCVKRVANEEAAALRLPVVCKSLMLRCAGRSICGRRSGQAVTCCRTNFLGYAKCRVKSLASQCRAPAGGTACVTNAESCCEACAQGCASSTTTTPTTTTTSTT
jgi:hypothetical protein